jgi:hypothetical protein
MEPMRLDHATVKQFKDVTALSSSPVVDVTASESCTPSNSSVTILRSGSCDFDASSVGEVCPVGSTPPGFAEQVWSRPHAIRLVRWGSAAQKLSALDYLEPISVSKTSIHILRRHLLAGNADMIDFHKYFVS